MKSPDLNSIVRTALPSKDGLIYIQTTVGEFIEIGKLCQENPDKYEGTDGFMEALRVVRDRDTKSPEAKKD